MIPKFLKLTAFFAYLFILLFTGCSSEINDKMHKKRPKGIMPVVLSVKGEHLTNEERVLFEENNPFGFILFPRNISSVEQTKKLISDLTDCISYRRSAPILIDQEGGVIDRLRRLEPRIYYPAPIEFGRIAKTKGLSYSEKAVFDNYYNVAKRLKGLGFTINCVPIADLYDDDQGIRGTKEKNPVIVNRSFSDDVNITVALSKTTINAHDAVGITSVIKHMPGHGLSKVDSHDELPIVSHSLDYLEKNDFTAETQKRRARRQDTEFPQ